MSILSFWTIVLCVVGFASFSEEERANIVGLIVNLNLVVFYGAPLGTILKVCESKDSSSIHRRTVFTGLFNAFFWSSYGLAILDMVIFVPNACGFLLAAFQLLLCLCYPRGGFRTIDEFDSSDEASERMT